MDRLTRLSKTDDFYVSDKSAVCISESQCIGEIVDRLAKFENLHEHLIQRQQAIPLELEALRLAGKNKTVTFKECLTEKMIVDMLLGQLRKYGIE